MTCSRRFSRFDGLITYNNEDLGSKIAIKTTRSSQVQYDKHTLHSNNLYQIFTYVKNRHYEFGDEPHVVSGMLLYAKTEEEMQPDNEYQMHGSRVSVKTIDLNLPFADIAMQLNNFAIEHFGDGIYQE